MRILFGLWLLQAFSAGSAWLVLSGADATRGELFVWVALVMGTGLLVALWLWTALRDQRRLGEARQLERMASKSAALQANLARQRAADTAKLRDVAKKASRPQTRLLTVALVSGGLGLGVALVLTQLLTLGLVALAFAGGGGAGYMLRGRLARSAAFVEKPVNVPVPAPARLVARRRRMLPFLSERAETEVA